MSRIQLRQLTLIPIAGLVVMGSGAAQSRHDMRDVVVTKSGKELRGRVVRRYEDDELLMLQHGKRVRVPVAQVQSVTTVVDLLREFFRHRDTSRGIPGKEWQLVEWAQSKELDAMARLQAVHVVLENPDHAEARAFLGHSHRGGKWLWPHDRRWLTLEQLEDERRHFGRSPFVISEHFQVRSDAPLRDTLDATFDLERLYVFWFDEFGRELKPQAVIGDLMEVHIHESSGKGFPAFTSLRYPYYFPQPNGDVVYTYFAPGARTPELLMQLGTEQLIYNTLSEGVSVAPTSPKNRIAAWAEIGLGQWVESRFSGDPGYARPGEPRLDIEQAKLVLSWREYGLENMIGLRYSMFHDVHSHVRLHWANVSTFVAFLMSDTENGALRKRFLTYLYLAHAKGRGNSSSLFDKVFGTRIEKLEPRWIAWLEQKAGVKATRVTRR